MSTVVVLVIAVGLLVLVFFWSGHYGGRNRIGKTSLRRGPSAHTTARGRAKKGYASREEALIASQRLRIRDGTTMNAYLCSSCAKWHLGH